MSTQPTRRRNKKVIFDIERGAAVSSDVGLPEQAAELVEISERTALPCDPIVVSSFPVLVVKPLLRIRIFLVKYPKSIAIAAIFFYISYGLCIADPLLRRAHLRPFTSALSAIFSLLGFIVSVSQDVHEAVLDGRTQQWHQAINSVALFLKESGLEDEWSETLHSNLFLADLIVLTDIQKQEDESRSSLRLQPHSIPDESELLRGQQYMRYATAVYGREMIASAQLHAYGEVFIYPTDTNAQVIAKHVHLAPDGEVWFDDLTPGENANHESLRTIVVCDHSTKTVVVSIRGTYSLSGIIVDLAAFSEEFCGGWAHAGFASAARNTWRTLWETVLHDKLKDLPADYGLVLTGHSMGAGVACLMTILLYHERPVALRHRSISCYAMAPPPVFGPLSAAPKAVANIIAFVHGWDGVPSFSVDAIRRLLEAVCRIDAVLQQHPMWRRAAERYELGEPAEDLVDAYEQDIPLRELHQAPMLFVPARELIWLVPNRTTFFSTTSSVSSSDSPSLYTAHALDPALYANRVMDVKIPNMMTDHLIPEYESAFQQLLPPEAASPTNKEKDQGRTSSTEKGTVAGRVSWLRRSG